MSLKQTMFAIGDVVQHRILGSEKVIVGLREDRYLCASRGDIQENGRLRPEARVAMHRRESLRKVGRLETVRPVNMTDLYEQEYRQTHRIHRKNFFKEEMIPYSLFLLAVVLIVLALLTGVDEVRARIESTFFRKVEGKKIELRRGVEKARQNGIDAEEIEKLKRTLGR